MVSTAPSQAVDGTALLHGRLAAFGTACLLLSWTPWLVLGVLDANIDEGPGALIFALAASGPSLAALLIWLRHRRTDRMPSQVTWSWRWPLTAIALGAAPPVLTALLLGVDGIPAHASSVIAGAGGPLGALAYTFIAGPLAEEFGWRGYVQPRLRQYYGRLAVTVALGAAWGLWHVPLYFLNGTGQHEDGIASLQAFLFFLSMFPLTYTILFVSEHLKGGVWAAILVHAAWNLSEQLIPPLTTSGLWLKFALITLTATTAALIWNRNPLPTATT